MIKIEELVKVGIDSALLAKEKFEEDK